MLLPKLLGLACLAVFLSACFAIVFGRFFTNGNDDPVKDLTRELSDAQWQELLRRRKADLAEMPSPQEWR